MNIELISAVRAVVAHEDHLPSMSSKEQTPEIDVVV
jgi:hypothetical protein